AAVAVRVGLIRVRVGGAVVGRVTDPVAVRVGAGRDGGGGRRDRAARGGRRERGRRGRRDGRGRRGRRARGAGGGRRRGAGHGRGRGRGAGGGRCGRARRGGGRKGRERSDEGGAARAFRARLPPERGVVAVVGVVRLLPLVGPVARRPVGHGELGEGDRMVVAVEEAGVLAHAHDVDAGALGPLRDGVVHLSRGTGTPHREGAAEVIVRHRRRRRVAPGGRDPRRRREQPVEDAGLRGGERRGVVRVARVVDRAVAEGAVLLPVRGPVGLARRRRHVEPD